MNGIRYPNLYDKLRAFTIVACTLLTELALKQGIPIKEERRLIIQKKNGGTQTTETIMPKCDFRRFSWLHEKEITSLSEASDCAGWLASESEIPKPVVTDSQGRRIEKPDYAPFFLHDVLDWKSVV